MHCVPIGPYSWSFVCKFSPCILILSVPIGLVLCACIHCTSCPHSTVYMHVAKNNTIFATTCLHIPMHSPHNLSFVEKCVIKLSYLAQPHIILYASAIAASSLFLPTGPYGVRDHALVLVTHPYVCVYIVQMALYHSWVHHCTHTHTHTHTQTQQNVCTVTHMATP